MFVSSSSISSAEPCADLDVPINGALACDMFAYGRYCSVLCNDQFDVPKGGSNRAASVVSKIFICASSGIWYPHHNTPDCTRKLTQSYFELRVINLGIRVIWWECLSRFSNIIGNALKIYNYYTQIIQIYTVSLPTPPPTPSPHTQTQTHLHTLSIVSM